MRRALVGATILVALALALPPARPAGAAQSPAVRAWFEAHARQVDQLLSDLQTPLTGETAASQSTATPVTFPSATAYPVLAVCQALQKDLHAARTLPPIPGHAAEQRWRRLLTRVASGARDCLNSVSLLQGAMASLAQLNPPGSGVAS